MIYLLSIFNIMIPTNIYINFYIFIIIILVLIGVYAMLYKDITSITKTIIIWYLIILIVNLLNIISVFKFYEANKTRKGPKGDIGLKGPRGFRGQNQICSSCGDAGRINHVYGSVINDIGEKVFSKDVKEGKCIFPFSHNYKYNYDCIKDSPPPGQTTNDAKSFGWCATEINSSFEPTKYAYCNANSSIQEKLLKEAKVRKNRKEFLQNNYGILDVNVVSANTTSEARKKCESKIGGYKFIEKDLNEGTDGKFIHLCVKEGYGDTGVTGLRVEKYNQGVNPKAFLENNNELNRNPNMYHIINQDLNKDSGTSDGRDKVPKLYLYKQMGNKNYIKDINLINESEGTCESINYSYPLGCDPLLCGDLNFGSHRPDNVDRLQLCVSREIENVMPIDTAFVYKDDRLYFFRGDQFYKMKLKPVQGEFNIEKKYPKNIAEKWGKQKFDKNILAASKGRESGEGSIVESCNNLSSDQCESALNCTFSNGRCSSVSNYDAAFTYGYDQKTYFFRGSNVYIYDDKKMMMTRDSPKKIKDVFPGVPSNISAVFTWAKDNKTYFFRGPFYYKYDDKNKKVERGYPKRTNRRWKNMPPLIDAIFSIKMNTGESSGNQSTYVVSGDQTWFIDPINDNLINQKSIDNRFLGLSIMSSSPLPTSG